MGKRELLASGLDRTGLGELIFRIARWRGLLVFNYHRIGDPAHSLVDHALWSASQEEFDRQVAFLKHHCDVVGVSDLDGALNRRKARAVLITFDDGYRDNFDLAYPVLRAHGTPAVFFIASGFLDHRVLAWWDEIAWMVHSSSRELLRWNGAIGREEWHLSGPEERERVIQRLLRQYKSLNTDETQPFLERLAAETGSGRCPADVADGIWMTWDMVREMDQNGMDIGGHTVNHPVLANAPTEVQRREIRESKRRIETELGHPITAFSYPVGQRDSFTPQTKELLREAGYQWAFSFFGGFAPAPRFDCYDLPRVAVSPLISPVLFRSTARHPWLFA